MQAHVEKLPFEQRSNLQSRLLTRFERRVPLEHGRTEVVPWSDLWAEEWQHQVRACSGLSFGQRLAIKRRPVQTQSITQRLACK